MAIGGLIPLTSVLFVNRFSPSKHGQRALALFTPVSLLLSILSVTPLVVVSLDRSDGSSRITQGPLYLAFALHVLLCFSYAIGLLYSRYRAADEPLRSHLKRLLWALGIPIAVGTTTNLLLPLFFKSYALGNYGPCFTIVMVVVIAHAIIRHRLIDVRVVIKQGAVYLAAFFVAGFVLLALLLRSNALIHEQHGVPAREILLALLVAFFFGPLKSRIQRAFDRYLYRQPYDYKQTISQASRALSTTIALPALLERLGNVVDSTLRPEGYSVYLLDEEDEEFRRAFVAGSIGWPDRLPVNTVLLTSPAREGKPVFRDEIGAGEPVLAEMQQLGSEVVIALLAEARVFGLVAIGPKRSGDPYYSDDADLLATLANQSAVAIRNAQTHQQVLEANEYIQKILATIESGVISVSARGRIRLFNRAAEVMTGTPAEGVRGRPIGHLRGPLARLIDDTLADGQSRSQVELALPDAAGQIVPLMCSTAPLRSADGVLTGAVAVVSDLSRLKELEQEKRRVERLAALESIASGLVHEIRNPLVAIKTFTQLLPSRAGDPSFGQDVARVTDREVSRIEDLLGRFRTLAAPPSAPLVEVDVAEPLHATIELLRGQMEQRQIRLRYVADGPTRPVLGDASQLEQLFLNVCLNALEAMETGGELTIRLADLRAAGGTTLLVEVCDTGTGIPEDLLPIIFNPFVTTKARGSGLGLAICRSIADAHRATLVARNNVGRPGSTFTLEFPVIVASSASTYA
jgi:PAS domain S-box-containing protein